MTPILIPSIVLFALSGLPLFLVIGVLAIVGFHVIEQSGTLFFLEFIRLAENPTLIAIPLFTLSGFILAESQAPKRMVNLAYHLVGWLKGGMGIITVLILALMTAFTGASGITIIAFGGLMFPILLKSQYSEKFSLGLITSSGSIGLLFAPSLPIILYGIVSTSSIDALFRAGIVPGLLLIISISIYCFIKGHRLSNDANRVEVPHEPFLTSLKEAAFEIPLPLIIIGGIYGGFLTVTEAAVATVVFVIIVEVFIKRDIHPLGELPKILKESSILVGAILMIFGSALALTNVIVYLEIPMRLIEWIQSIISSKVAFLLVLNLFLLVVGAFMDIFSAIVIIVPLILPIALSYDIDPIHLGIMFLINLEIGYSTPPIGLNLFISSFRFNKPVLLLYKAAIPFLIIQFAILILITYIPSIVTAPLKFFMGRY